MTINNLRDYIVYYIENNKVRFDIKYENSIESLYQLLNEIKKEYEGLE